MLDNCISKECRPILDNSAKDSYNHVLPLRILLNYDGIIDMSSNRILGKGIQESFTTTYTWEFTYPHKVVFKA